MLKLVGLYYAGEFKLSVFRQTIKVPEVGFLRTICFSQRVQGPSHQSKERDNACRGFVILGVQAPKESDHTPPRVVGRSDREKNSARAVIALDHARESKQPKAAR